MKNKKQLEHQEKVEKKLKKFFAELMKMIGFIFMTAFAVLGAIFYYVTTTPQNHIVQNLMVSVVVVTFLWMMITVKEEW